MKVEGEAQKAFFKISWVGKPLHQAREEATFLVSWPLGSDLGSAFLINRQMLRAMEEAFKALPD